MTFNAPTACGRVIHSGGVNMTTKGIKNGLTIFEMKIFLFLIMICCICIGCPKPTPQIPAEISYGIEIIGKQKSRCVQWAKKVKSDYSKNTGQHQEANSLYIDAKAAFDGWIDQLKFGLTVNAIFNESERYKASLLEASEQSEAFLKYVKSLPLYQTKSKFFIVDVLPSLTEAGIKLWEEYRKARKERREEIKRELDNLKWPDFGKI